MANTDIALFLIRLAAGVSFVSHGWPKLRNFTSTVKWFLAEGFPLPLLSTVAISLTEFVGGILIILGVYIRYVCWFTAFGMLVATFFELRKTKTFRMKTEVPLLLFASSVALIIAGGGAWQLLS